MQDYTVELDVFHGPMDLLLYLIRRHELDVRDIPMARLTGQFVEHVAVLRELHRRAGLDIDAIGDFLVMAATLTEVKSRTLLPRPEADDTDAPPNALTDPADPRHELVTQLLEYKRLREAAAALEARADAQALRHRRQPARRDADPDEPPPIDLDEVQVYDLLAAFTRLMGEVGRGGRFHEVTADDTPLELHAADIEDRLRRAADNRLTLRQLFAGRPDRGELIGVFLALLELVRENRVTIESEGDLPDPSALTVRAAGGDTMAA